MERDYLDRLNQISQESLDKETTAKSFIANAEDNYKILGELKKLNSSIDHNKDKEDEGENQRIINSMQIRGVRFNVVEYDSSFVGDLRLATGIYHAQQLGMRLRSLVVDLNQGKVTMESGLFQSSEGQVKLKQRFSPLHMVGGIVRKMNEETFFRPEFGGTGTVRLMSNFKFIHLIHVPRPTRLVLEKGIYLASAGEWKYKTAKNLNIGMMFFSDKSLLQTELKGAGLVALELPVHPTELVKHTVTPDRPFKVSGEYVLYWTGNLKRKINPVKNLPKNMASGVGVLEEYTGEGYVYTAPTLGYYSKIASELWGKDTGNTDPIREETDMGKRKKSFWERIGFRGS